jgi:putative DNA primase/helicase
MTTADSTRPAPRARDVLAAARAYAAAGLSVVPVPPDGTKRPRVPWRRYQLWPASDAQLVAWFAASRDGVAVLCGRVSGDLEVLDFDEASLFAPWAELVGAQAKGVLGRLVVVRTPGPGYHVYLRCPGHATGNQKLAMGTGPGGRPVTLIETRGEGGLVLSPACPPGCHPSGRSYVLERGDLAAVPAVAPEERGLLLDAARSLTRHVPPRCLVAGLPGASGPARPTAAAATGAGRRPGDHYNATASWPAILEPHGWRCVRTDGAGVGHWRRPGKPGPGWSATTDYAGAGLLYVFSSNAAPFEPGRAYTKFAAHALLDHGGDFRAAARALRGREGCPEERTRAVLSLPEWPGTVAAGSDGSRVRRLPPPARPAGVPLKAFRRPTGGPVAPSAPRRTARGGRGHPRRLA